MTCALRVCKFVISDFRYVVGEYEVMSRYEFVLRWCEDGGGCGGYWSSLLQVKILTVFEPFGR